MVRARWNTPRRVSGPILDHPPRVPHSYYANPHNPWSIWWLHVTGADITALLTAIGLTTREPTAPLTDPLRICDLTASVVDDLAADETAASLTAASGGAWNLLARLAAERNTRDVNHEPIARVQVHLREHLASPTNVPALAEMAGFSTSHFSARFRAATGYTVLEYVKRLRMARARQLLITSDASIGDVAAAVGFQDPLYFSRQFSAVNQLSPSRFRAPIRRGTASVQLLSALPRRIGAAAVVTAIRCGQSASRPVT
jgi:AraC family transcriptional regulator of arabinose operon